MTCYNEMIIFPNNISEHYLSSAMHSMVNKMQSPCRGSTSTSLAYADQMLRFGRWTRIAGNFEFLRVLVRSTLTLGEIKMFLGRRYVVLVQ